MRTVCSERLTQTTIRPAHGLAVARGRRVALVAIAASPRRRRSPTSSPVEVSADRAPSEVARRRPRRRCAPATAPADAEPAADADASRSTTSPRRCPALEGAERGRAEGLLARPTDGADDPYRRRLSGRGARSPAPRAPTSASSGSTPPGFPTPPTSPTPTASPTATGRPTTSSRCSRSPSTPTRVEVAPGPLGWAPPKPDVDGCGASPGTHADIYLKQLGNQGAVRLPERRSGPGAGAQPVRLHGPRQRLRASPSTATTTRRSRASVTFAHEFNHLLQVNYDTFQDTWMFEATATWSEEQVYPGDQRLPRLRPRRSPSSRATPITAAFPPDQASRCSIYGSAVWNHWLDTGGGGYGSDVVRRAWELSDAIEPADFALAAYDRAIETGRRQELQPRVRRLRRRDRRVADRVRRLPRRRRLPGREAQGLARARAARSGSTLDHTAYRLLDVNAARRRAEAQRRGRATACAPGSRWSPATATRSPAR